MINRINIKDIVPKELLNYAKIYFSRLPVIPDSFEMIDGKRIANFDEKKILCVLEEKECRDGSRNDKIRKLLIKKLKEKLNENTILRY